MDLAFILKKIITFFIEPLGFTLSLFAFGIYFLVVKRERIAKYLLSFSLGVLLLFSYLPFSNYLILNLEHKYKKYDYKQKAKYIHVLGSGHTTDISQPISSQLSTSGVKRVLEGVIIYKKLKNAKLIFTGYAGSTEISNAQMNSRLAMALGVNKNDIISSPEPKNTKEEALFLKSIIGKESFILVTSATHMPRSIKLFKSLGLEPIPAPTDFHKEENVSFLKLWNIHYLKNSSIAIHEYIGLLWSKLSK